MGYSTMKKLLCFMALLVLFALLGADWPVAVKIGDPLILTATQMDATWSILPSSWKRIDYPNSNQIAFDTSRSGVIGIVLIDPDGVLIIHHQVIVGSGQPEPSPGPEPNPQPLPNPVEYLFGMVFFQSEEVDDMENAAEVSQVLLGLRLRSLDENFQWMPTDIDKVNADGEVPEDVKPWLDLIKDKELEMPHLFLVDQDGKLITNQVLPETVDEVIVLIRKVMPE